MLNNIPLFICVSISGPFGCFHHLAAVNSAAIVDMGVHIFLHDPLGVYAEVELLNPTVSDLIDHFLSTFVMVCFVCHVPRHPWERVTS